MASTYVNDLRLNEMATGDQSGSWGTVTNTNLELIGEALGYGTEAITTNADTHASVIADGATDPVRALYVEYTGTLDSACTITISPNTVNKVCFIENGTAGSQNIIISQGSGANVTIPPGDTKAVYLNGAGSGAAVVDAFASLSVVDLKVQDDLTVTDDASVGGDLLVSGEVQTANIGFTDGDNAMVIADGGAVTFPIASVFTSGFQSNGAINVGVDDTGYDVKFFGATASAYMQWDASTDDLILGGAAKMGIGETAPGSLLHVKASDTGIAPHASAQITLEREGTNYLQFLTGEANTSGILFGDGSDTDVAAIKLDHNTTDMTFATETNVALTIAGEGDIIIANTGGTLQTATAGTSNFRAGVNAGNSIASGGNYNVCVGDEAGTAITTADSNVAVGYQALATEDTLSESVAVGYRALALQNADDSNGGKNVSVGFTAGEAITTGNRNTFVGHRAGLDVDTADGNVAVGGDALFTNTGGESNTAIGFEALRTADANSGFIANTACGVQAGKAVTDGVYNTLIGAQAGLSLQSVNYNTVVGAFALDACSHGSQTTAIGYGALTTQDYGTTTTTSFNTAVGYLAAAALSTGQSCTVMGNSAGQHISSGSANTFLGSAAGTGVSGTPITGSNNTAIGQSSGQNLRGTAHSNSFLGKGSGASVTTGYENTYIGFEAGDGTETAISNTALGYQSLSAGANGGNTAIGRRSLIAVTGSINTGLGKDSGLEIVGGSNNMCLGHDSGRSGSPGGSITSGNNTITLGDNNIATANIKVDWTVSSDQRDKTDFTALDIGLDFVKALNPVTYKWDQRSDYGDHTADDWSLSDQTPDGTHKKDWLDVGFKAQEVEALEQAVGYNKSNKTNLTVSLSPDGEQYGMKYSKFVPILVKAIQEQNALIEALTARVATLEG